MRLGIAIANHNQRNQVLNLLRQVERQGEAKIEVLFLDHDCQVEERMKKDLRKFSFEYDYCASQEWLTFGARANFFLDKAEAANLEAIWFIPMAVQMEPKTLRLLKDWVRDPKVGAWGRSGGYFGRFGQITRMEAIWQKQRRGDQVDWVDKAGLLMRMEVVQKVGRFNEQLYQEWEEVEYCWRIKKMGYECRLWPEPGVRMPTVTPATESPLASYFRYRNQVLLARQFGAGGPSMGRWIWLYGRYFLPQMLREGMKNKNWKKVAMAWAGLRDGWELAKEEKVRFPSSTS